MFFSPYPMHASLDKLTLKDEGKRGKKRGKRGEKRKRERVFSGFKKVENYFLM